jgi:hypothetical protein
MKNKQKIAGILVAMGVVCYIANLVVYVPKFGTFLRSYSVMEFYGQVNRRLLPQLTG